MGDVFIEGGKGRKGKEKEKGKGEKGKKEKKREREGEERDRERGRLFKIISSCKTPENSNFLKKSKTIISVKNSEFF